MTFCYSEPFESLIAKPLATPAPVLARVRVLIVGSGYGGAIAAYRLSGRGRAGGPARDIEVAVLERGREYALGELPNGFGEVPGHLRVQRHDRPDADGNADALFNFHLGKNVDVLVGSGLGGTSLINANVALRPPDPAFSASPWPTALQRDVAAGGPHRLRAAFDEVEKLLGVASETDRKQLMSYPKYKAFARFAKAIGCSVAPAPITVNLRGPNASKPNPAGVVQEACTGCGNCVTGCNVGAKNTVAMNAIPAAWRRGAKFYTGAEVIRVVPIQPSASGLRWSVHVRPVDRGTRARCEGWFVIEADTVVLSAGTLGSTQILQRSENSKQPMFSTQLGKRFSTNGDAIAMSFSERDRVGAMGSSDYLKCTDCGPTITAVAQGEVPVPGGATEPFTLEEGAVPASIVLPFGELITTAAQLRRVGNNELPGWLDKNKKADPLASHPETRERSQIFLWMGRDGSEASDDPPQGYLEYETEGAGPDGGITVPVWTPGKKGPSPPLERINATFAGQDRKKGLNKGQYVPNPLWELLPREASGVMEGKFPGGRLITVHPLGGCVMGDTGEQGVVDANGQVFRSNSAFTYPGLHVLDGAIVPSALGVNPFLTIAALSWRACDAIAQELNLEETGAPLKELPPTRVLPPRRESDHAPVIVRERLVGMLEETEPRKKKRLLAKFPTADRWFDTDGLILQLETVEKDTPALLDGSSAVRLTARLYQNEVPGDVVRRSRMYGAPDAHLTASAPFATGFGTITLMQPDYPPLGGLGRAVSAFLAYLGRRESLTDILRKKPDPNGNFWSAFKSFANVAFMHATYREFAYSITLTQVGDEEKKNPIKISGKKKLAWRLDNPRMWEALLELPIEFVVKSAQFSTRARLVVDMRYLLGTGLIRMGAGANVPLGLLRSAGFLLRLARSMLQSSFWEFGAPPYPATALERQPRLPAKLRDGTPLEGPFRFEVPRWVRDPAASRLTLHLHRYAGAKKIPVLLVHGLAQGSLIYADPSLKESMSEYFHARGYDVWLLDYRLSNQFDAGQIPYDGWAMDEIGKYDIPLAVAKVLEQYVPNTRVHLFAHCVGAVGTTMAIFNGSLDARSLASVCLNAIHPWTIPSAANTARAKLAVFYRDFIVEEMFDPIIQTKDTVRAAQSLLDRLGFSLSRIGEGPNDHELGDDRNLSNSICDRMTLTYGRMWRHANVKRIHANWKNLVGRSPVAVQRHLYYSMIEQRVLDRDGQNTYLLDKNFDHWRDIRTLFIHGEQSGVFNPQSATRSAIRFRRVMNRLFHGKPEDSPVPGTPIGLRRVPEYGHMDVILADDAAKKSFPYIDHFFQGAFDSQTIFQLPSGQAISLDTIDAKDDAHRDAKHTPEAGPVLRAARIENGVLLLRYWLELPSINTSPNGEVDLGGLQYEPVRVDNVDSWYWWADARLNPADYVVPQTRIKVGGSDTGVPLGAFGTQLNRMITLFQASVDTAPSSGWLNPRSFWRHKGAELLPPWLSRLIERSYGTPKNDCYFLVASCRYPGTPFDTSLADEVFSGMFDLLNAGLPCDLLFLIGDQIYADATAGLLDPTPWKERYTLRYRQAFSAESMQKVLAWLPCHFAVDDHEFADNYLGSTDRRSPFTKYRPWHENEPVRAMASGDLDDEEMQFAVRVAHSYMDSARFKKPFGQAPAPACPRALWYELDDRSEIRCPAFVMDTRSERQRARNGKPPSLMSTKQMAALKGWLSQRRNDPRPKFIFAGSVIVPVSRGADQPGMWMREDGIAGYPDELREMIEHIVDLGIQRVVFVGGDLHVSCAARMALVSKGNSVNALQIVSSGLYAPLPFANLDERTIDWDQPAAIELGTTRIEYRPEKLAANQSHFVRVGAVENADKSWTIAADAYDVRGTQINHLEYQL